MANLPFNCKDCKDRYPGCHSKCERYKLASEIWEKEKAKRRMEQELRNYTRDSVTKKVNAHIIHQKGTRGRRWFRYGQ